MTATEPPLLSFSLSVSLSLTLNVPNMGVFDSGGPARSSLFLSISDNDGEVRTGPEQRVADGIGGRTPISSVPLPYSFSSLCLSLSLSLSFCITQTEGCLVGGRRSTVALPPLFLASGDGKWPTRGRLVGQRPIPTPSPLSLSHLSFVNQPPPLGLTVTEGGSYGWGGSIRGPPSFSCAFDDKRRWGLVDRSNSD